MSPLDELASLLAPGTEQGAKPLAVDQSIDRVLAEMLVRAKSAGSGKVPEDLQIAAVRRFWESQSVQSFRDAYQLSWALCVPHKLNGTCILEDRSRFQTVLKSVSSWETRPAAFRRCYQGLVKSYFTFDSSNAALVGRQNWAQLRDFLHGHSKSIKDSSTNPDWVTTAVGNRQLFAENPCEPYVAALLRGDNSAIEHLCNQLGIAHTSWFLRELILAQVHGATKLGNAQFVGLMQRLLDMLKGNEVLRDRGMVMVLDRYAKVPGQHLNQGLRDSAVLWWGNPWLPSNETRWGGVTEPARTMVADWLKLEFIETFFTKLAEDGMGDPRRMDFWKRYVKSIDNIQFALGSFARTSRERDFVLLRKKMTGLICELDASGANNAFVMTMGNLIVVEFSGMGNALYGYDAQRHIPFDISKPLKLRVDAPNSLKHSQHIIKLSHQDGIHGWEAWEPMFQATLKKEFGITPGTASAPTKRVAAPPPEPIRQAEYSAQFSHASLNRLARENGLQVEDKTPQGGSLWVRTHGSDVTTSVVTQQLTRWGFKLRPGKGWWK
jgi:hypothetical protein